MHVLFRPEARDDVIQARDWYESRAIGLGGEFVRALEAAIAVVQRNPEGFPFVVGEYRRALLRRFPYVLIYERQGVDLVVLVCFHHRRDSRVVSKRLRI